MFTVDKTLLEKNQDKVPLDLGETGWFVLGGIWGVILWDLHILVGF